MDPASGRLKGLLEEEGVSHRGIAIQGDTREKMTVTEEESRDQYRFVLPGPQVDKRN